MKNVSGNPFDLEFKLAPVLREWLNAIKNSSAPKQELLPVKEDDRPVLKLMRLRECVEHSHTK